MNLLKKIFEAHKRKIDKRNAACLMVLETIVLANTDMDNFLLSTDDFLSLQQGEQVLQKHSTLQTMFSQPIYKDIRRAADYKKVLFAKNEFMQKSSTFLQTISTHNDKVAQEKLADAYNLIGNVEGRKLDSQQMLCILKEAHSHLVIAGAGTGKTTTIVGKIKFLLQKGICEAKDILVLSFTNASASEMRERIQKETKQPIEASTFHKLGLNIIKACDGTTPKITQIKLRSFIKEKLTGLVEQPEYLQKLSSYFLFHSVIAKSEFEFNNEKEYREYLDNNPPTTLRNERVKSYGELDIANFLSQNSIEYKYEDAYPVDTRTDKYGQYYPDFYLPEYKIYIEYFGVNEKGEVPSYFSGTNGKTASETYLESMEWKRSLHAEQGTKMIECFAGEKFAGNLLERLEEKLKAHGVRFVPKSSQEILDELMAGENALIDGFSELVETVINLIKSNNYSMEQVKKLISVSSSCASSNSALLNLINPIYEEYCAELKRCGEIDFNDMVNIATQYVSVGKYQHKYKYVIVDEYQDISKARFSLLKAMRDTQDYTLFCVGDDWQSIYRFAGSDIGFILNFQQYWGASEISRIETTYRFPQGLIDISSRFVMTNPNQVRKTIQGVAAETTFPLGEINGYTENNLADFLSTRLVDLPQNSTVFFIGRYSFDIDYIKKSPHFTCKYNNVSGNVDIIFLRRRDLHIEFITAHKSKGLQADFVFILNNKKARMGFPSKMQDAPILDLLLNSSDNYPYSEERRLFYVALTRAKKKVILLTLNGKESTFVAELQNIYGDAMKREAFTCPKCGGRLVKRSGPYGEFFGCSNYKTGICTYTRNINKSASL